MDTPKLPTPQFSVRLTRWTVGWALWKMENERERKGLICPFLSFIPLYIRRILDFFLGSFLINILLELFKKKKKILSSSASFSYNLQATFNAPIFSAFSPCCKFISFSPFRLVSSFLFLFSLFPPLLFS